VADDPIELGESYQAPTAARPPPRPIQLPVPPAARPRRGLGIARLFWIVLLGVGVYGGYFGYCRYKVGELERALSVEMQDFRQKLIRKGGGVGKADVPRVLLAAAGKVGVAIDPTEIQVRLEPITPENTSRLPSFVQSALALAATIPGEKKQLYLVGYQARAFARHGVAKRWFDTEQYTYLESDWIAR
jgi:hypothetical protein